MNSSIIVQMQDSCRTAANRKNLFCSAARHVASLGEGENGGEGGEKKCFVPLLMYTAFCPHGSLLCQRPQALLVIYPKTTQF